ncbi:NAD(P)H-binding protein [Weeksellaceae bacterium TAE3-ERU29]|nr:NAD(P)H-binding protein [Weeksellaceae bacterium TAE3-ERU29]
MRAVVIGGTGATGNPLIKFLLGDNEITEVISLVRNPKNEHHPKLKEIKVDFDHLENYRDEIKGDIAFSCLGTTLKVAGSKDAQWKVDYDYQYKFAEIAKENEIPTFVLLSAQNANPDSFFFYSKMKGKLEESIKKLDFKNLIIVQPSILIRPNSERFGEKVGVHFLNFVNKLGLMKNYQPLPTSKVAKALVIEGKNSNQKLKEIGVKEILNLNK